MIEFEPVRLLVSLFSACVVAVSIVISTWHLLQVLRYVHSKAPITKYVFGIFLLTEQNVDANGRFSLQQFWKWVRVLVFFLGVLAVSYPFPLNQ